MRSSSRSLKRSSNDLAGKLHLGVASAHCALDGMPLPAHPKRHRDGLLPREEFRLVLNGRDSTCRPTQATARTGPRARQTQLLVLPRQTPPSGGVHRMTWLKGEFLSPQRSTAPLPRPGRTGNPPDS